MATRKRKGGRRAYIDQMRRDIRAHFGVRGTVRASSSIKPRAEWGRRHFYETHFYRVTPMVALDAKQFLEKFHATLNAAISRALYHALDVPANIFSKAAEPSKVKHGDLPKLEFLHSAPPGMTFRYERNGAKTINPELEFRERDTQYRKNLEVAHVRGKMRRTFLEGAASGTLGPPELLFKVSLTKPEYVKAVSDVNRKLAAFGVDIGRLQKLEMENEGAAWGIVKKALRIKHQPKRLAETDRHATSPSDYIIGEEIRRVMIGKAMRGIGEFRNKLLEQDRAERKKRGKKTSGSKGKKKR